MCCSYRRVIASREIRGQVGRFSHLLDDLDAQEVQARADRARGQVAEQQAAVCEVVRLGLQDGQFSKKSE